jgi:hypothetical protein
MAPHLLFIVRMRTIARAVTVCAALFLSACAASAGDPSPAPAAQGSLVVSWTFNETSNSATCNASNLEAIDIDLADENGNVLSSFSAPCTKLSAMVMLSPGNYRATTHFVDVTGAPKSVPVQTKDFELLADERVNAVVDFQSSDVF